MDYKDLTQLVLSKTSKARTARRAVSLIRKEIKKNDIPVLPWGIGNDKTNLPGFYRKVGDTCPKDCPYLVTNTCFGLLGPASIHQKKASNESVNVINTFVIIAILSSLYYKKWPARLLVTGDFFRDNAVDWDLIHSLKEVGSFLSKKLRQKIVGYAYTHAKGEDADKMVKILGEGGITLLKSDHLGPGGAMVYPFDRLEELPKSKDYTLVPCVAQKKEQMTCSKCRLCKNAVDKKLCIVFKPHGSRKNALSKMILEGV